MLLLLVVIILANLEQKIIASQKTQHIASFACYDQLYLQALCSPSEYFGILKSTSVALWRAKKSHFHASVECDMKIVDKNNR